MVPEPEYGIPSAESPEIDAMRLQQLRERFLAVLAKIPDVEPFEEDRFRSQTKTEHLPNPERRDKLQVMQHLTVELIPDPDLGGYTARVPDIPAYGEGATEEAAISDLKEALAAYVEAFGIEDAMSRLNAPSVLRQLDMELEDLVRA